MSKKILLSCTALILVMPMTADAETLKQAVQAALSAHPTIEAARQAKDIAALNKKEARSAYFPEISANAAAGRIYGDNSTSRGLTVTRGAAYSGMGEVGASISQPLFDGFETKNRVEAADERIKSQEFNIMDAQENLSLQAVQAYMGLYQAQKLLTRARGFKKSAEDFAGRIEMMVNEGAADQSELAQANNVILGIDARIINFEGQVQTAMANYRQIMGAAPASALSEPSSIASFVPESANAAFEGAQDHPMLMALDNDMRASDFDARAEKGTLYPDINAELSAYKKDQREEIGGEVEDARALLKMNWNFSTGGAQYARMDRAKAQRGELLARKKEVMRQIEGDINRSYAEMQTAQKQKEIALKQKSVTADLLQAYETQFEGGRVRLLQLLQGENQLFNMDVAAMNADNRYLMAQYAAMASMGQLSSYLNGAAVEVSANTESLAPTKPVMQAVKSYIEPAQKKLSAATAQERQLYFNAGK